MFPVRVLKQLEIRQESLEWSHFVEVTGLLSRIYAFLKTITSYIFQGMFGKNCCFESLNFRRLYRRTSFSKDPFRQFELSNWSPATILKTDSTSNFSCEISENFQNILEGICGESFFTKEIGKISTFCNFAENCITCIVMFRKMALLEILTKQVATSLKTKS